MRIIMLDVAARMANRQVTMDRPMGGIRERVWRVVRARGVRMEDRARTERSRQYWASSKGGSHDGGAAS